MQPSDSKPDYPHVVNTPHRKTKADYEAAEQPPPTLRVNLDGIPDELKARHQWVAWRWLRRDGRWTKVPINPRTGKNASCRVPSTWGTFADALRLHLDGVGYEFSADDDYCGVDFDDCRDPETGDIDPWVAEQLGRLGGYTEVSPTGTGLKSLVKAVKPAGKCQAQCEAHKVEVYDRGRFFALTGHALPDSPADVPERQGALDTLYQQMFREGQPKGKVQPPPAAAAGQDNRDLALSALAGLNPQRAAAYEPWIQVGMALHSVDAGGAMLNAWDEWSRQCPEKYQVGACAGKWASFNQGGGITLGSLIHWAMDDGWTLPSGGQGRPQRPDAYTTILDWLHEHYVPTFRRGDGFHSVAFGKDITFTQACRSHKQIIDRLAKAADAPRNVRDRRRALLKLFADWVKPAVADLIRVLDPEPEAVEISPHAAAEFRRKVAQVLHHHVPVGVTSFVTGQEEGHQERRPLIQWCSEPEFCQVNKWSDIRGYRIWVRKEPNGQIRVCMHPGLFGQVPGGAKELANLGPQDFGTLCELYHIGRGGLRLNKARVVELETEFLAEQMKANPHGSKDGSPAPVPYPGEADKAGWTETKDDEDKGTGDTQ
jgi:hypothetical protein